MYSLGLVKIFKIIVVVLSNVKPSTFAVMAGALIVGIGVPVVITIFTGQYMGFLLWLIGFAAFGVFSLGFIAFYANTSPS